MDFGEKIKLLRQERNLNQPELAEQLGIEQSYLSKLETGKSIPSGDVLERILSTFGIGIDVLLRGIDAAARKQLKAIPQVASFLERQQTGLEQNRRHWILGAAMCCVMGLTVLSAAWVNLVFPDTVYTYLSEEIVPRGDQGETFASIHDYANYVTAKVALEIMSNDENPVDSRSADRRMRLDAEMDKILLQLSNLRFPAYHESRNGPMYIRQEVTEPEETGMLQASGISTGAVRTFSRVQEDQVYRVSPLLLFVVGSLFLFLGMFGFILERIGVRYERFAPTSPPSPQ